MAATFEQYEGDGNTRAFPIPFPYLDRSHIQVSLDGVIQPPPTFLTASMIQLPEAPAIGVVVDVRRKTPTGVIPVNFQDGSILAEKDLDALAAYAAYLAEEGADTSAGALLLGPSGNYDALGRGIENVADATLPNGLPNKGQMDAYVAQIEAIRDAATAEMTSIKNAAEAAIAAILGDAEDAADAAANSAADALILRNSAAGHAQAAGVSAAEAAASAASVNAANLMQLTGDQAASGVKTFTDLRAVTRAAKTANTDVATTAFVDRFRSLHLSARTSGNLTVEDRGSLIVVNSGGDPETPVLFSVPPSVFQTGDVVWFYNHRYNTQKLRFSGQPGMTMLNTTATGSTAKELAPGKLALLVFLSPTESVLEGFGAGGLTNPS